MLGYMILQHMKKNLQVGNKQNLQVRTPHFGKELMTHILPYDHSLTAAVHENYVKYINNRSNFEGHISVLSEAYICQHPYKIDY
jgi:hypothetical protein